jgi:hypothetical protein
MYYTEYSDFPLVSFSVSTAVKSPHMEELGKCEEMRKFCNFWLVIGMEGDNFEAFK